MLWIERMRSRLRSCDLQTHRVTHAIKCDRDPPSEQASINSNNDDEKKMQYDRALIYESQWLVQHEFITNYI